MLNCSHGYQKAKFIFLANIKQSKLALTVDGNGKVYILIKKIKNIAFVANFISHIKKSEAIF